MNHFHANCVVMQNYDYYDSQEYYYDYQYEYQYYCWYWSCYANYYDYISYCYYYDFYYYYASLCPPMISPEATSCSSPSPTESAPSLNVSTASLASTTQTIEIIAEINPIASTITEAKGGNSNEACVSLIRTASNGPKKIEDAHQDALQKQVIETQLIECDQSLPSNDIKTPMQVQQQKSADGWSTRKNSISGKGIKRNPPSKSRRISKNSVEGKKKSMAPLPRSNMFEVLVMYDENTK
jgi:hypothetical protein